MRSPGVCNGWFVCDLYFSDMCVWIRFDAWLCLVGDIFMETDSCSIFKGRSRTDRHVGQNAQPYETAVRGFGYGHTHVGVDIVVRL